MLLFHINIYLYGYRCVKCCDVACVRSFDAINRCYLPFIASLEHD